MESDQQIRHEAVFLYVLFPCAVASVYQTTCISQIRLDMSKLIALLLLLIVSGASAQLVGNPDTLRTTTYIHQERTETVSLLLYNRIIFDAHGNVRLDQNIVPTFRLNNLFKLQIGFRLGERPHNLNSYYHYKIELQTKQIWNTVRFLARMSTNVIEDPGPDGGSPYTRSNYLGVAEGQYPLTEKLRLTGGVGYLHSFRKSNDLAGLPIAGGSKNNHVLYKVALHYAFNRRGFVGAAFGTYDVFNPYNLNEPFAQVDCEYDFSERSTLYSYYRYQEAGHFNEPLNHFICLGVRLHFFRR